MLGCIQKVLSWRLSITIEAASAPSRPLRKLMAIVGSLMLKPKKVAVECCPVALRMCLAREAVAFAAGKASGFFGIGGGSLIVPGLMLATGMPVINAISTAVLSVGPFGPATALNYASSGPVDWLLAAEFIGGGIVGGVLGMLLATRLSTTRTFSTACLR